MELFNKLKSKKKKRKFEESLLLMDYNCLTKEEAIETVADIRKKLLKIFKYHIGEQNAITPYNLFVELFGVGPYEMDIYKRTYWWNILKKVMAGMRSDGSLFVINNHGRRLYVLQTKTEANTYKAGVTKNIEALRRSMANADDWVAKEKWKDFY